MGARIDNLLNRPNYGGFSGGREDNWGQYRQAMKQGHFSGFTGNLLQEDMVTQASMGPIVDRTKEHLSTADVAVIQARRLLLGALDDMHAGIASGRMMRRMVASRLAPSTMAASSSSVGIAFM